MEATVSLKKSRHVLNPERKKNYSCGQEDIQLALYSKHTQSVVPRTLSTPYSIPT
jgi:hypothetical protein